jgi:hypothetical protein
MTASTFAAYNPFAQLSASGSFNTTWDGLMQGTAMADPSARNWLANGVLASTETLPMWGGVAISENIPPATSGSSNLLQVLGGNIIRATNVTANAPGTITGFSVFDQNPAMVNTPTSPVPTSGSGGQVNFYCFGTNARIAVACDPSLASDDGSVIATQFSWDFVNQRLVPYAAAYPATTITGATWASTSGGQTTFTVSTNLTAALSAGDDINVSGVVSTGGTGVGYNGAFTVVSVSSTTVVVTQVSASSPGTYSSGGTIAAGGGAVPIRALLKVVPTNSMTVSFNATTNYATWNRNGSAALILL